jgi:hypothetical protein
MTSSAGARIRAHPRAWLAGLPAGRIRGLGQLRWPQVGTS